ncbi:MAG TPA: hypothetical protein VF942_14810, partial [Acidimicrobiales bacterium]
MHLTFRLSDLGSRLSDLGSVVNGLGSTPDSSGLGAVSALTDRLGLTGADTPASLQQVLASVGVHKVEPVGAMPQRVPNGPLTTATGTSQVDEPVLSGGVAPLAATDSAPGQLARTAHPVRSHAPMLPDTPQAPDLPTSSGPTSGVGSSSGASGLSHTSLGAAGQSQRRLPAQYNLLHPWSLPGETAMTVGKADPTRGPPLPVTAEPSVRDASLSSLSTGLSGLPGSSSPTGLLGRSSKSGLPSLPASTDPMGARELASMAAVPAPAGDPLGAREVASMAAVPAPAGDPVGAREVASTAAAPSSHGDPVGVRQMATMAAMPAPESRTSTASDGSVQTVTPVYAYQRNQCGSTSALLFFDSHKNYGTCGPNGSVQPNDVASQQTVTPIYAMQQNGCGSTTAFLLFVDTQKFGGCGQGTDTSGMASQQVVGFEYIMQQSGCGSSAGSAFFVTQTDWGACDGPAGTSRPLAAPSNAPRFAPGGPMASGASDRAFMMRDAATGAVSARRTLPRVDPLARTSLGQALPAVAGGAAGPAAIAPIPASQNAIQGVTQGMTKASHVGNRAPSQEGGVLMIGLLMALLVAVMRRRGHWLIRTGVRNHLHIVPSLTGRKSMTNPPTAGRDGPAFVADDCGGKGRGLGLLLGLMSIFVIGLALQLSGLLGSSSASAAPLGTSGGVVPSPLGVTGPVTIPGLENMAIQQVQPKGGLAVPSPSAVSLPSVTSLQALPAAPKTTGLTNVNPSTLLHASPPQATGPPAASSGTTKVQSTPASSGTNVSTSGVTQSGPAPSTTTSASSSSASPANSVAVSGTGSDAASQQMITAVGGEQQNPCGSNIASLFFVTQQGFAHCAGSGSASTAVSTGSTGSDAASQQMITAVGGEQQNPCGSNIASLFFVTQQGFAHCAGQGSTLAAAPQRGPAVGTGSAGSDAASQQMITAVGGEQQNPCGSNIASLFFVTQQGFAHCAGSGSASTSVSTG